MYLVILIPCFNEEKTIREVISMIPKKIAGISKIDIVVINDGSTDKTEDYAKKYGAKVVSHPQNLGVGAAFQTGINESLCMGAQIIVNIDGDGQFNPQDIPTIIKPILKNNADFVTASRFKDKQLEPVMPKIKKWGNRKMSWIIGYLTKKKFMDVSCGFRAYSSKAALNLNLFGKFTYTHETVLDLSFKGLKMVEIPLKIRGAREFGKSRIAASLWKYALNTLIIIFRTYRDNRPLAFFGSLALFSFSISFGLFTFLLIHFFLAGQFSPHIWAGFSGGFFFVLAIALFLVGLLADMLNRIRVNQERLVYFEKCGRFYGSGIMNEVRNLDSDLEVSGYCQKCYERNMIRMRRIDAQVLGAFESNVFEFLFFDCSVKLG